MTHIVMPAASTRQGHAFEDLILSYYRKSGRFDVREWSSYLHGASGKWWQCDGIVENDQGRYLVEAKFFRCRPATARDIDPARREAAARDMDCTGLLYISLNGFAPDMLDYPHNTELDVRFLAWSDLRADLLSGLSGYASVLLDQFDLMPTHANAAHTAAVLHFDTVAPQLLSPRFPEFVTVSNSLELWLRRMPRLPWQLDQTASGQFWYDKDTGQVALVPDRASDLCLREAWEIQDALSGYASRTYTAVRATAEALSMMSDGLVVDLQSALHNMGWKTGVGGVRNSLDFLVQLGLADKWMDGRKARYTLSPLGQAYTVYGPNDDFFAASLQEWLPYRAVCQAIAQQDVTATADSILTYFKAQYEPYEPYARSLFNPNKADGLTSLYRRFGY